MLQKLSFVSNLLICITALALHFKLEGLGQRNIFPDDEEASSRMLLLLGESQRWPDCQADEEQDHAVDEQDYPQELAAEVFDDQHQSFEEEQVWCWRDFRCQYFREDALMPKGNFQDQLLMINSGPGECTAILQ